MSLGSPSEDVQWAAGCVCLELGIKMKQKPVFRSLQLWVESSNLTWSKVTKVSLDREQICRDEKGPGNTRKIRVQGRAKPVKSPFYQKSLARPNSAFL